MQDLKSVVDKQIDTLAKKYADILKKHKMIARVNTLGLSDEIVQALAMGKSSVDIEDIINTFFDKRIEKFDKIHGEEALRKGKTAEHRMAMEDLRGLRGKIDKTCAKTITENKTVKESLQYLGFAEGGVLISPELVNKNNISEYKKAVENAKRFPQQLRPDNMLGNKILVQTNTSRNTRRILLDNVREQDQRIMDDYDKMVAHYLLMGGDKPTERFSRIEMSMKQYGLRPDLGFSIMKYGDKLTTKLEELAAEGNKSPQEWDIFKNQVLHSFNVAESIGNRNVNSQEHMEWEERLVRLGILEKRIERPTEQGKESLRESLKVDDKDKPSHGSKQGVILDSEMIKRAQRAYENTGTVPLGYKLGEDGKTVVSIASTLSLNPDNPRDKLSASKRVISC